MSRALAITVRGPGSGVQPVPIERPELEAELKIEHLKSASEASSLPRRERCRNVSAGASSHNPVKGRFACAATAATAARSAGSRNAASAMAQ